MMKSSSLYAATQNNIIRAKGSAKAMRRLVKNKGGAKAGWQTWMTTASIGTNMRPSLLEMVASGELQKALNT
jgi:hypothetical protein